MYRLAKLTGRKITQISQIEKGRSEPMASTIIMIARALNMRPGELLDILAMFIK